MPKQKTHSGAKKRFKVTASGRLRRRRAFGSHLLTKKSSKRKRKLRKDAGLSLRDEARMKGLLGM